MSATRVKARDIDLLNAVRKPLSAYLQHGGRDPESPYVFTSEREERLSEAGIHHWFMVFTRTRVD